jgi:hypothetical protein
MALSGIPCADGQTVAVKSEVSVSAGSNSHNDHNDDSCSPFCVCNCCQSPGFLKMAEYASSDAIAPPIIEIQLPQYTSTLFPNFQNTIWQPPKIS